MFRLCILCMCVSLDQSQHRTLQFGQGEVRVRAFMYSCMYVHAHTFICTHKCMHTYLYAHKHTHFTTPKQIGRKVSFVSVCVLCAFEHIQIHIITGYPLPDKVTRDPDSFCCVFMRMCIHKHTHTS
jgi:hypothetical protein